MIIILMVDDLLNYQQQQQQNEGKRPRVYYWKQAFHILINNIRIILNDYPAGIIVKKNPLLQYTTTINNILIFIPFLICCYVRIYSTSKKCLLAKNSQSNKPEVKQSSLA